MHLKDLTCKYLSVDAILLSEPTSIASNGKRYTLAPYISVPSERRRKNIRIWCSINRPNGASTNS